MSTGLEIVTAAPLSQFSIGHQKGIENAGAFTIFSIGINGFFVALAGAIDGTHVKVLYSKPPVVSDALNAENYTINNGVSVLGVVQETALSFILTTSPQTPNVQYTLFVTGVHDMAGDAL